jgi:hypothetical protein
MIRDVLILSFVGALVLSFGLSVIGGGVLLFAANAFLYCVAYLAMALGVYASTQFWAINSRLAYSIAVPVAAVFIVAFLGWLVGSPTRQLYEIRSLGAVVGPFLAANVGAYWLVVKKGF